ncbi:hypothetical protein WJX72_006002 [[Myrmecia] bisecta]|uniref:AAA+ ATPase domain-containing protein n=1 Tax=[Myrmecia] bisecta TaxID=41462 RepID=A0AAW1PWW2_9CHLO
MALRRLAGQWRVASTGLAAGLAATGLGVGVAYCEDPRGPSFDPEALERGAAALREINKSPYAKKVIELSKQQEITKAQEAKTKQAEFEAYAKQSQVDVEKVRWEEQRKMRQQDAQTKAQLAQYEDELARKRAEFEHNKQRERNAELVQLQLEAGRKQEQEKLAIAAQIEAERQQTEKFKADLEKQVQREKALAEAEGRIKENRENEDVNRRQLQLKLEEDRKRLVEAINSVFSNLGQGAAALLTDRDRLVTSLFWVTALAVGVYSAREGTKVAGKAAERWLGTPKLVRETSRRKFWQRRGGPGEKSIEEVRRDFSDIILPGQLHNHVRALAAVTANTKRHGAPFRHMLFYGPPGTGKTMAAKRLARTSGLDYAIMSGGDVAPLGGGAVTQLHELFDWAEGSRKGLLLFIDEADAFLGQRGANMSEGLRGALNAVLFRTGDQSRDFAVVLATNRPGDLDPAVIDRMDEAMEFDLPGLAEREKILKLYLDQYIVKAGTAEGGAGSSTRIGVLTRMGLFLRGRKGSADVIATRDIDDALIQEAAEATEGFSGRELAKMVASMQAAVYGSRDAVFTPEIMRSVVQVKVREHLQRQAFAQGLHHRIVDVHPNPTQTPSTDEPSRGQTGSGSQ